MLCSMLYYFRQFLFQNYLLKIITLHIESNNRQNKHTIYRTVFSKVFSSRCIVPSVSGKPADFRKYIRSISEEIYDKRRWCYINNETVDQKSSLGKSRKVIVRKCILFLVISDKEKQEQNIIDFLKICVISKNL